MSKINQGEYEKLKSLGNQWEWMARDWIGDHGGDLFAYSEKPFKNHKSGVWDYGRRFKSIDNHLFQFVQWEEEMPWNIQKLIEEYEFGKKLLAMAEEETVLEYEDENEETEMKSKQELIEKWEMAIESAEFYGRGREDELISYMKDFVSDLKQLEESEVLSQELPVIPQFVAEWIETDRGGYANKLFGIGYDLYSNDIHPDVGDWLIENEEKFVRAWLDGFTVEEEQKYYLKIGNLYLAEPLGDMTSDIVKMTRDKRVAYQFTDEKSIATHLDKFEGTEAVKVEE